MSIDDDPLTQFLKKKPIFARIHKTITLAMGQGQLRCAECGKEDQLTQEDVERYLRIGWPTCCAKTMGFYPVEEFLSEIARQT